MTYPKWIELLTIITINGDVSKLDSTADHYHY